MSFQITKYLQFRNTINGKPSVLVEGVDYHHKTAVALWDYDITINGYYMVANLADCRPLLMSLKTIWKQTQSKGSGRLLGMFLKLIS